MKLQMLSYFAAISTLLFFDVARACQDDRDANESGFLCGENSYDLTAQADFSGYSGFVKFIIEVDETGKFGAITYMNTKKFPFHYDYVSQLPKWKGKTTNEIDAVTLRKTGRKILFGTVLYRRNLKIDDFGSEKDADFEVVSEDFFEPSEAQLVYQQIRATSVNFIGDLRYLPAGPQKKRAFDRRSEFDFLGVPLADGNELSGQISCYTSQWTVGNVRKLSESEFEKQSASGGISERDFLVLEYAPRDLPAVAGLVVENPTAPSSHVALLAQMYGIPFFYEKNAMSSEKWNKMLGKSYFISAKGNASHCQVNHSLIKDESETELLRNLKDPRVSAQPRISLTLNKVVSITSLDLSDIPNVGGKAGNYSVLAKTLPDSTPLPAAAIPQYFYARFLAESKVPGGLSLGEFILQKVHSLGASPTANEIRLAANEIRRNFLAAQIDPGLFQEIEDGIVEIYGKRGVRLKLRSSSNAEDSPEFNGAGLYDSEGVCLGDTAGGAQSLCDPAKKSDPLQKGLVKVWASLFTERGLIARQRAEINEESVGMAVLVNPATNGELANGVAILKPTGNGFDGELTGFPGEDLEVTHPPRGEVPETTHVTAQDWNRSGKYDFRINSRIPTSVLPIGQTLLRLHEYKDLTQRLIRIANTWPKKDGSIPTLDFEWKLIESSEKRRKILIKQVRAVPTESRTFSGIILVGDANLELKTTAGEGSDSIPAYLLRYRAKINMKLTSFENLLKGYVPFRAINLFNHQGELKLNPDDAKVIVESQDWHEDWQSQPKTESRRHAVKVYLAGPLPENTFIGFTVQETRSAASKHLIPEIIGSTELEFFMGAPVSSFPKPSLPNEFENEYSFRMFNLNAPPSPFIEPEYYQVTEIFQGAETKVEFKGESNCAGFCKTRFLEMKSVVVSGLTKEPLTIVDPDYMIYAPAHHNFSFEYLVDLYATEGLSKEALEELKALGVRYLRAAKNFEIFSSGDQAVKENSVLTGFSENWTPRVIDRGAFESQGPHGPGNVLSPGIGLVSPQLR